MKIKHLLFSLALLLVISNSASAQTCDPDAYESDDDIPSASTLTMNEVQQHGFHKFTDSDWVIFDGLVVGREYIIKTFALGPKTDTFLRVYDYLSFIGADDDLDEVLCSYEYNGVLIYIDTQYCSSIVVFVAKVTGPFYAHVMTLSPYNGEVCQAYSLTFTEAQHILLPFTSIY